jgi:hypothetical protein
VNQSFILDLAREVKARYENQCEEILTKEEMDNIDYKGIYDLAKMFGGDPAFCIKLQWFYYDQRERSLMQLLEEIDCYIKDFENKYGGDFQTVFGHLRDREESDGMSCALDYNEWLDYLEERNYLIEKLGI